MRHTAKFRTAALLSGCLCALAACAGKQPDTSVAASPQTGTEKATTPMTDDESGFIPLFDGRSLAGWHLYRKPGEPVSGWAVEDGTLRRVAAAGDLVTDRQYGDFDLRFDWKIAPGGNSGVFYRASEQEDAVYWSGIEYQVLDNERHPDGKNGPDRHAAAVYGMYPPAGAHTRPVGEWNQGRIVARDAHVEHWLNGAKVAEYELWTPQWKALVARTKFKDWPRYGMEKTGVIGLQDHGDEVAYRNIRLREL